jgi:replicative DNA helicase
MKNWIWLGVIFTLFPLPQRVSSSAHIEFHARIILQKYIQRSLIKISNEIIEEGL